MKVLLLLSLTTLLCAGKKQYETDERANIKLSWQAVISCFFSTWAECLPVRVCARGGVKNVIVMWRDWHGRVGGHFHTKYVPMRKRRGLSLKWLLRHNCCAFCCCPCSWGHSCAFWEKLIIRYQNADYLSFLCLQFTRRSVYVTEKMNAHLESSKLFSLFFFFQYVQFYATLCGCENTAYAQWFTCQLPTSTLSCTVCVHPCGSTASLSRSAQVPAMMDDEGEAPWQWFHCISPGVERH